MMISSKSVILTFWLEDPYKPSFTTITGRGPHPKCMHIYVIQTKTYVHIYLYTYLMNLPTSKIFTSQLTVSTCTNYSLQWSNDQANFRRLLETTTNMSNICLEKQRQETQVSRFQTFLTTRGPMLVSQHSTDSFRPFPSTPKNMQRTAETSSHQAVAAAVKQLKRKRSDAQTSTFAHFSEEHIT